MRPAGRRAVLAIAAGVAVCGILLLALMPDLDGRPGLRTLWIAVSLALMKLPVLGLLWWLFTRRRRGRDARWDAAETARVLDGLDDAVTEAGDTAPPERFGALQADAWRAAREGDPSMTARAVEIALRIDRVRLRSAPPAGAAKFPHN